jgi:HEAT repeat protein
MGRSQGEAPRSSPQGSVTLKLELSEPRGIPAGVQARWQEMIRAVRKYDAPYLVFLGELLGLLDADPQPRFTCRTYSDVDMFGGRDQDWELRARRASIRRQIKQAINDSWQSVEVDANTLEIRGLPSGVFIEWEGDLSDPMEVTIGNISPGLAEQIAALAGQLFAAVKQTRTGGSELPRVKSASGALRSELKRELRFGAEPRSYLVDAPSLLPMLWDEDEDVALAALAKLERVGLTSRPEVLDAMMPALQHDSSLVRSAFAKVLAAAGTPAAVLALIAGLGDSSGTVRAEAAAVLARAGGRQAVPALVAALADRYAGVRKAAVSSLGSLLAGQADPAILEQMAALLTDDDQYVRDVAAWTLKDFRSPVLLEPLLRALADPYFAVRHGAVLALTTQGDARAVPDLIPLLEDEHGGVRISAVEALAELGDLRAREPLARLAADKRRDPGLRDAARAAVRRLDGRTQKAP